MARPIPAPASPGLTVRTPGKFSPISAVLSSESFERVVAGPFVAAAAADDDSDTGSILVTSPEPSLPRHPTLGRLLPRASSAPQRGMDLGRLIHGKIASLSAGSSRRAFRMPSSKSARQLGMGGFAERAGESRLLRYDPENARGMSFLALLQNSWRKYVAEMETVRASLLARRDVLGHDEPKRFFSWFRNVFAFTRCWVQMLGRLFSGHTLQLIVENRAHLELSSACLFVYPAELEEILKQTSDVMKMERQFGTPSRRLIRDVRVLCDRLESLSEMVSEYLEDQFEALLPLVDEIIVDDDVLPCFIKWILRFIATRADPVFLTHAFVSWSNEKYLRQEVAEFFAEPFCEFERANIRANMKKAMKELPEKDGSRIVEEFYLRHQRWLLINDT